MSKSKQLWKTTIVIWSDEDPSNLELEELACEADRGGSICTEKSTVVVDDPKDFPDTEFFNIE